jgi:iron complex transport system permease protein
MARTPMMRVPSVVVGPREGESAASRARGAPVSWPRLDTPVLAIAAVAAIVLVVFAARLSLGTVPLPIRTLVGALVGLADPVSTSIVIGYRLPRALASMLAGAGIAVSGLLMQTMLRNPLAGPWILGVVGCSRFGVAVLLTVGPLIGMRMSTTLGPFAASALAIAAIIGAAVGMTAMAWLSSRIAAVTLLIAGVITTYLADSAAQLLITFAATSQKAIFTGWNDGSFDNVTWPQLQVFLVVGLAALIAAIALLKVLDALVLGDRYAGSLGHSLRRTRRLAVLLIVVLAGSVTAFCGPIAFLDVAAPQMARSLFRTMSHKALIPATALIGSLIALAADLVTSLPGAQQVFHLNHAAALVGGPVILWVLLHRRERAEITLS